VECDLERGHLADDHLGLALGVIGYVLPRSKSRPAAMGGVAMASIGLALTSHAALAPPIALAFPAFVLHVALAAFWFGSLPFLILALARAPRSIAYAELIRFSSVAVWGVAVLLGAGAVLTLIQSGPDLRVWTGPAWTGGPYGPLLACKLVVVVGVLALALHHKRRLTPNLGSDNPDAADVLRRSIRRETGLMVGVLALAASLGSFEPPRSTAALASVHDHSGAGAALYVVRQGYGILLEMSPAETGANEITIRISDPANDGARVTPLEVTIGLALPEAGIEPLLRRAKPIEDGAYRVELMPIPTPGIWQVQIDALITDFDKLLTTIDMPIEEATKR
jgi:copper transport protein